MSWKEIGNDDTLDYVVGVKGRIFNRLGLPIASAAVMINDRQPIVRTTSLGEFWRVLIPGVYTLKVRFFIIKFTHFIEP